MKKIILTMAIAMIGYSSYAQTNTFPSSGNVGIGTTETSYSPLTIQSGISKTTSTETKIFELKTNESFSGSPFKLTFTVAGNSTLANRNFLLQTGEHNVANGGNIVLQPQTGNVGIGTTDPHGYKLAVNGSAIAESVTIKLNGSWPDYVFKPAYHLPALASVKAYIDKNQHLPEMPSEQEVKDNGINLGEIVKVQTKKIEELTLYLIDKEKQLSDQQKQIEQLKQGQEALKAALSKLIANSSNK